MWVLTTLASLAVSGRITPVFAAIATVGSDRQTPFGVTGQPKQELSSHGMPWRRKPGAGNAPEQVSGRESEPAVGPFLLSPRHHAAARNSLLRGPAPLPI